ncbi:MAG: phosphoribosylamine--glycine ligase [Bacteroidales bacterium]|nr:phosphoribosylamine--glycine ligase [Bacteroidales bacterium]
MNVLLLGNGGRENAIAWKIKQSKLLTKLYVAPGNAGTSNIAENINLNLNNFKEISDIIIQKNIDLLIIGSETPLVNGIFDFLKSKKEHKNLLLIGPDKNGATLEGSKDFAKKFMQKYKIPTAKYFTVTKENVDDGIKFLQKLKAPFVLKADGLAAGKGVLIIRNSEEAIIELQNILSGKFGNAGEKVVIEEFLDGIECSVFVLTDGKNFILLPEAKDYKRIGEGNTGLNTGGMGAISPVPFFNEEFKEKTINQIIIPTITGIAEENFDYCGFVFFGLMNVNNNPFVIEYNVRLGDPETEAIMPRIKSDFLQLLIDTANKKTGENEILISAENCATVMLVSRGYPENYETGKTVFGLDEIKESIIFHAGTKIENSEWQNHRQSQVITSGGRVLSVSSVGQDMKEAVQKSYNSIKKIKFEKMYCRNDIGFEFIKKQ